MILRDSQRWQCDWERRVPERDGYILCATPGDSMKRRTVPTILTVFAVLGVPLSAQDAGLLSVERIFTTRDFASDFPTPGPSWLGRGSPIVRLDCGCRLKSVRSVQCRYC